MATKKVVPPPTNLTEDEKRLVEMTLGKRPETDRERTLAAEIKEIEAKGRKVEIPSEIH